MDNLNNLLKQRREKAQSLADDGVKLFSNDFKHPQHIADILPQAEALEPETHAREGVSCRIAGRVMVLRRFGKAAFFQLQDETSRIQIYARLDVLGEEEFGHFKKWDAGDIVGVEGRPFKTKTGEPSIEATKLHLICKSLRPLPEKFHGLTDVETRYRQRYVDLIVNPEVRSTFRKRMEIIRLIRAFLANRGFLEVETPMLHPIPGGAAAKPFITHHNALDMELYLRIAPELYLKRLLVGGFERVFEINRNFRNEGLSTRHNPEFTMLEFYQAYATYEDMMDCTEEMISSICQQVNGSMQITYQGTPINLAPPWRRLSMTEALSEVAGLDAAVVGDDVAVMELAKRYKVDLQPDSGPGKARTGLFELLVEEKLINPTFITSYPAEISPLARRNEADPSITDRFELFITGREIANSFSELNDPIDQRERFVRQIEERGNDEEIHPEMDEDFVRALEYGMPSAAGEGIGIDRLVMLLTDSPSIRDVILFPHLKAEVRYKDINGNSGIRSCEIGENSITVHFKRGGSYLYTNAKPGEEHIAEMKRLAELGDGLNTYINKYVRENYASKLA